MTCRYGKRLSASARGWREKPQFGRTAHDSSALLERNGMRVRAGPHSPVFQIVICAAQSSSAVAHARGHAVLHPFSSLFPVSSPLCLSLRDSSATIYISPPARPLLTKQTRSLHLPDDIVLMDGKVGANGPSNSSCLRHKRRRRS
jgi:hypothetical protein